MMNARDINASLDERAARYTAEQDNWESLSDDENGRPTPTVATISRYRLLNRTGKFAWYYGYDAHLSSCACGGDKCGGHAFGRHPLESIRRWARERGATEIVETWKAALAEAKGRGLAP